MTSSLKRRVTHMEEDARLYWRTMSRAGKIHLADPSSPELEECFDDMEVLRDYTDWQLLRQCCATALVLIQTKLPPMAKRA